jgi:hypothetical protein
MLTRRNALRGAGAAGLALAAVPLAARAQVGQGSVTRDTDLGAFARAAAVLTGAAALPDFFLAAARSALIEGHGADAVARFTATVAAAPAGAALPAELEPMAQALLTMLYTGEIGSSAPYYPWALAWRGLGFTKAPGICGDAFGSWTKA